MPQFPTLVCLCALTVLGSIPAQAQALYRIVGADGRVTFSDRPPAVANKASPIASGAQEPPSTGSALPYALQQVVGKYPVTLYTSKDCAPCDSGRQLLRTRGIPFSEKTITTAEDAEALQRLAGGTSLPLLTVGGQQIKGFSDNEWSQYLSAAGYPEKSLLPARYVNPAPAPLVAIKVPTIAAESASTPSETRPRANPSAQPQPRVNPSNPTGIQF